MENENFVISSLFSSFLGRRWRGSTEKIEGNSLSFSFLFSVFFLSFDPSSFQFLGGGMEREKDRGNCLLEDKRNLQEHLLACKCPKITVFSGTFCNNSVIDTAMIPK